VVLGLETWLNVEDHLEFLDAVGSPAVQVYYDVANMTRRGYNVPLDIRRLGKERICQVHCKEGVALLGEGKVDFRRVKDALNEIHWTGWLVIEGAIPPGGETVAAYRKNQQFLRNLFPTR
jgi:sugar phosphate isomerase/epimerase